MRSAEDMQPVNLGHSKAQELPINRVADDLTSLEGPKLEIMTRTTIPMVKACQIGYIYAECLGSSYVRGRIDQMMRLAVSMDGGGRQDMIESLRAGGKVPDSVYEQNGRNGEFTVIQDSEDDDY